MCVPVWARYSAPDRQRQELGVEDAAAIHHLAANGVDVLAGDGDVNAVFAADVGFARVVHRIGVDALPQGGAAGAVLDDESVQVAAQCARAADVGAARGALSSRKQPPAVSPRGSVHTPSHPAWLSQPRV